MFLNIQIDLIILTTYDQQLATKKSLHIIFKGVRRQLTDINWQGVP